MARYGRLWVGAAAAAIAASAIPAGAQAQSVQGGVEAWGRADYADAVRQWRPLADRGDPDAQFNLGHAYRLGRGVPQNMTMAEMWYERAARTGHTEAQAMYGLLLFQNGRRQEAMPFVRGAAERGDARAQYVYGTALFNGDVVTRDWAGAYAFMLRSAAQGLPYAQTQLNEMEQHISAAERARGTELAQALERDMPARAAPGVMAASTPPPVVTATPVRRTPSPAPPPVPPARTRVAAANPPAAAPASAPPVRSAPTRIATTEVPASTPAMPPAVRPAPRPAPPPAATRPATPPPAARRPTPPAATASRPAASAAAAAGGRWRVQLGAFSNEANARRAWSQLGGRLGGLQPYYVRAGVLTRLQAGPLADRAAAERTCSSLRATACFVVSP